MRRLEKQLSEGSFMVQGLGSIVTSVLGVLYWVSCPFLYGAQKSHVVTWVSGWECRGFKRGAARNSCF